MVHYVKTHSTDYINENYVHMLVQLKEILTKMYFCMPPELSAPIYTTLTQYTDFIFGQNLVTSKVSRQ